MASTPPVLPSWAGAAVAVLASGPSMSQEVADRVHAAGLPAIAINNTYLLAPWADMLYAADEEWWRVHRAAAEFRGLKVTAGVVPGVARVTCTGLDGIDMTPGCVRTGGNSGYQAIQLAAQAGARRVLLLGFDMHGSHWHGDHGPGLRNTTADLFAKWVKRFDSAAPLLAAAGIDVVNCTPGSAIRCFRQSTVELELTEVARCA